MARAESPHYSIVLLGEKGVGKTKLFNYLRESRRDNLIRNERDRWTTTYILNGDQVKISLWDTGGMEKNKSGARIVSSYYRRAHGVIFVYDSTKLESLNELKNWFKLVYQNMTRPEQAPVCALWGNKGDSSHPVEREYLEGFKQSLQYHVQLCAEVDVYNYRDSNVEKSFEELIVAVHENAPSLNRSQSMVGLYPESNSSEHEPSEEPQSGCFRC